MSTASRDEGPTGNQRGANYFFGFVFMFTVILLVIVGCGIGSRRRYFSSRRDSERGTLDPWTSGTKGDVTPPKLYDIEANFVNGQGATWKNIMVCCTYFVYLNTFLMYHSRYLPPTSARNSKS